MKFELVPVAGGIFIGIPSRVVRLPDDSVVAISKNLSTKEIELLKVWLDANPVTHSQEVVT